jgi:mono/diheme cytochrome c family protein
MGWKRIVRLILLGLIGLFVLIQFVPYGRDHTNPQVTAEPKWDSQRTRELAAGSCFDCHSNLTEWPWYTNVAPMSWLVQRDVDEGRLTLNFTQWDQPQAEVDEVFDVIAEGEMPPWSYTLTHRDASLSDAERQELIEGLRATFRASPPIQGVGEPEDE